MGKLDDRAARWCRATEENGEGFFAIEEKPSKTWGYIPSISTHEGVAARASGCGYDKKSATLAQFLGSLGGTIVFTGGAGYHSVVEACAVIGWKLEQVGWTKRSTSYKISRAPLTPCA